MDEYSIDTSNALQFKQHFTHDLHKFNYSRIRKSYNKTQLEKNIKLSFIKKLLIVWELTNGRGESLWSLEQNPSDWLKK